MQGNTPTTISTQTQTEYDRNTMENADNNNNTMENSGVFYRGALYTEYDLKIK